MRKSVTSHELQEQDLGPAVPAGAPTFRGVLHRDGPQEEPTRCAIDS